jgi:hypothetical protein
VKRVAGAIREGAQVVATLAFLVNADQPPLGTMSIEKRHERENWLEVGALAAMPDVRPRWLL